MLFAYLNETRHCCVNDTITKCLNCKNFKKIHNSLTYFKNNTYRHVYLKTFHVPSKRF